LHSQPTDTSLPQGYRACQVQASVSAYGRWSEDGSSLKSHGNLTIFNAPRMNEKSIQRL